MGSQIQVEDICKKLFGNEAYKVIEWCIKREKADRYNAIPKGKVANVFVMIEPQSRLLIRHESDVVDVTTVPTYAGYNVPAILNTKLQAVMRRQMLTLLHEWYDRNGRNMKELVEKYVCVVRPHIRREKAQKPEEDIEAYCGKCPACLIFGYVSMEEASYNVKSRVEGDIYVAPVPDTKACLLTTFNAVDDVTRTTLIEMGAERTGALYQLRLVEVGVPFVGKIVLRDMTLAELMLTLVTLSRVTRIGGRTTHFGEIKIHIPAILLSTYEIGSGYELANIMLMKYGGNLVKPEDALSNVEEYVNKFSGLGISIIDRSLADKLRGLTQGEVDALILRAWRDIKIFKESLDLFVKQSTEKGS